MMGLVLGIFSLGYALFQVPSSWIADKLGPRKALTIVVSIWSCFTALNEVYERKIKQAEEKVSKASYQLLSA